MAENPLSIVKEAAQIPGLLKEVYGDLAKPGVKQIGAALGTILGLGNTILWPAMLLNERAKIALTKNLEKYRERLRDIPEEKIVSVPPEIGVPISEKLGYVTNEELSNLYVNLLAKASTLDTAHFAHPAFVNLINSLSPDEALLLGHIHEIFSEVLKRRAAELGNEKARTLMATRLPFVLFVTARSVATDNPNGSFVDIADLLTGIETKVPLAFPHNTAAYFSNLSGLGIVEIKRNIVSDHPSQYEELETLYRSQYGYRHTGKLTVKFIRGKIDVTPFGKLFIEACLGPG